MDMIWKGEEDRQEKSRFSLSTVVTTQYPLLINTATIRKLVSTQTECHAPGARGNIFVSWWESNGKVIEMAVVAAVRSVSGNPHKMPFLTYCLCGSCITGPVILAEGGPLGGF